MNGTASQKTYNIVVLVVMALLAALAAIWLGTQRGSRSADVERASARYPTEVAAFFAEMDARLHDLEQRWDADAPPAVYQSGKELREGFRSLLRSATESIAGASMTAYAPEAEKLVRELEAEYAARATALGASLSPQARDAFLADTRRLEAQLSDLLRVLRREGKVAAHEAYQSFLQAYREWRSRAPAGAPPATVSPA